jgi:hypothetical protein
VTWGLEPIFGASEAQRADATRTGEYNEVRMVTLFDLIAQHPRIDLLHVDIQGGEVDVINGSLQVLREKVACILIGTHSREIEGRLMKTLLKAGWHLEMERPAIFHLVEGRPVTRVDGVQGWRNVDLLPLVQ